MRNLVLGCVSAAVLLSGCTFVKDERGYPGGFSGRIADNKIIQTRNHEQRIARYAYSLALVAPLVAETAQTPSEAQASANAINAVYAKLKQLEMLRKNCPLLVGEVEDTTGAIFSSNSCSLVGAGDDASTDLGSAFAFESNAFEVDRTMVRLAKTAADNIGVRGSLSRAKNLTVIDLAKSIYRARKVVPIALKYFATYRDVSLIVGDAIASTCTGNCDNVINDFRRVLSDRSDIADARNASRPISKIFAGAKTLASNGVGWRFSPRHYRALVHHVDRACEQLYYRQLVTGSGIAPVRCSSVDNGGSDDRNEFLSTFVKSG
ncbi:hypothetical protein [uncultured Litoreibacter sp.]|uniref:hypothetical protein n=1 Tax=uncultured Litoreibacter sp. TaxID=1392394 RepID=UPI00260F721E|nr:hypothetical protein [uncultured Litoreibacter sp.]